MAIDACYPRFGPVRQVMKRIVKKMVLAIFLSLNQVQFINNVLYGA
ncbi:hypothetical protein SAMN05192564_10717 [Paraburkholderia sartisoli]|uniref:Uncharacterized protein n=1 Tax=Paraburkholderia sartisoli TaxID=83784 RepID=A0A1H4H0A1_9BURK|nr:hypothetical protein SAMN05192564_10717 [Paraburkholderia sartisoli]